MIASRLVLKSNLQELCFWTCLGSFNKHSTPATFSVISKHAHPRSCSRGDGFEWAERRSLLGQPFPFQGPPGVHRRNKSMPAVGFLLKCISYWIHMKNAKCNYIVVPITMWQPAFRKWSFIPKNVKKSQCESMWLLILTALTKWALPGCVSLGSLVSYITFNRHSQYVIVRDAFNTKK